MKKALAFVLALWAAVVWCSSPTLLAGEQEQGAQTSSADKAEQGHAPKLLAAAGKADSPPAAGPKIVFPEPIHDFGTVARGASVSHNFKVRNEGSAPLEVISAKGG